MSTKLWQGLQRSYSLSKPFPLKPRYLSCACGSVALVWHVAPRIWVVKPARALGLWLGQNLVLFTGDDKNVGLVALTGKRRGRMRPARISNAIFYLYNSKPSCRADRREGRAAAYISQRCQQRMMEQVVPGEITSGLSRTCSKLPDKRHFSCNDFALVRNKTLPCLLLQSGRGVAPLVSLTANFFFFLNLEQKHLLYKNLHTFHWSSLVWSPNFQTDYFNQLFHKYSAGCSNPQQEASHAHSNSAASFITGELSVAGPMSPFCSLFRSRQSFWSVPPAHFRGDAGSSGRQPLRGVCCCLPSTPRQQPWLTASHVQPPRDGFNKTFCFKGE